MMYPEHAAVCGSVLSSEGLCTCGAARTADIWTDGRDSEAARAWRGEGRADGLVRLDPDEGVGFSIAGPCSGELGLELDVEGVKGTVYLSREMWVVMGAKMGWRAEPLEPNPDYTPAVRRVVAWEVTDTGDMHRDKRTAYRLAAHDRMTSGRESGRRAWRRFCEHPIGHKRDRRKKLLRDRYARLLRHWDEKEGHRG